MQKRKMRNKIYSIKSLLIADTTLEQALGEVIAEDIPMNKSLMV